MVRFVILAGMRTGSTLLSTTLDEHPCISCITEPFFDLSPTSNRLERLVDCFHGSALGKMQAVGCKLVYNSLDPATWKWFQLHKPIHVVHLLRNPIASFVSLVQARSSGVYHWLPRSAKLRMRNPHGTRTEPLSPLSVTISPEECRQYIDAIIRWRDAVNHHFAGSTILEVHYEQLAESQDSTFARVQRFLNVESRRLPMQEFRIDSRPLPDRILNLRELMEALPENYRHFVNAD